MSAAVAAMCARLVDERTSRMLATPQDRARLSAYLDTLDRTHANDPAMRAYVRRTRARLAARDTRSTT